MDTKAYREFLNAIGYTEPQIEGCVDAVARFEADIESAGRTLETATGEDVHGFAARRIAAGANDRISLIGIYQMGQMLKNHPMTVGALDLIDGYEILGNLHRFVGEILGPDAQARIFAGVELPVLGAPPLEWTRVMSVVLPRLEAEADRETVEHILGSGLRNLRDEFYADFKGRYEEAESLDAFLADRKARHDATLRAHRDEGTLYFNQRITDEVLDFVAAHPEIGGGVRSGDTVIEIKIPHMSPEYLATDDRRMKQYYVCHCPCVKESILRDDLEISPTVCSFCPSFNAKPWEVTFGRRLKTEVLESALRGDLWCKFAIHLPEGV